MTATPPLLMVMDCVLSEKSPATVRSEPAPSTVAWLLVIAETVAVLALMSCRVKPVRPALAVSLLAPAKIAWPGPPKPVIVSELLPL